MTKCKGFNFKAVIDGTPCEGRIQVEDGRVYLCQDKRDGVDCDDKLGFRCSWCIKRGTPEDMKRFGVNVSDPEIVPRDPETYKGWQVGDIVRRTRLETLEVIFRSGELVVLKSEEGPASSNYTCDELFKSDYRLVLTDIERQIIEERKAAENIQKSPVPEFRKGEPVLVRSDRTHCWQLRAISLSVYGNPPKVEVTDGCDEWIYWIDKDEVIPYNEKTMHLLGTAEDYKEGE